MTLAKTDFDKIVEELRTRRTTTIKQIKADHEIVFFDSYGKEFSEDQEIYLRSSDGEWYAIERDWYGVILDIKPHFYSEIDFMENRYIGIEEKDIDVLELPVRAETCLRNRGINTVKQLINMSEEQLLHIRWFGKKCLKDVVDCLGYYGLHLTEETKKV